MQRLARPVFITLFAALIVFIAVSFAATRLSKPANGTEFQHVTVEKTYDTASTSDYQGAPRPLLRLASMSAPASRSVQTTQIARSGAVSLLVSSVDKAISAVSTLTREENGDVLSLNDKGRTEHGGRSSADMQLRVPEDRFEHTLQALGRIGSARARSINAEDLTTQIVDSAARLRNLRRTERDIQKIMDRSGSIGQILEAENQLSSVREQIETLDADLKSMRNRVRYSTISVTLAAEASTAPLEPTAAAQLVSSWHAARHAVSQLTIGLAASIVWLAAFIPYLLLAALGLWLLRKRLSAKLKY
jgi:hypothetical protein